MLIFSLSISKQKEKKRRLLGYNLGLCATNLWSRISRQSPCLDNDHNYSKSILNIAVQDDLSPIYALDLARMVVNNNQNIGTKHKRLDLRYVGW